jgi:hypothetical protein
MSLADKPYIMPSKKKTSSAKSKSPARDPRFTLAHVTHEAVEQLGGIGTVLEGLITSPVYQQHVKRSILVGPCATHMAMDPNKRLGEQGQVLYSSIDGIDKLGLAGKLRPVEWAFNVAIVYGKRTYDPPGQGRHGESEVLLIDVFRANPDRLNVFKLRLWETFGIDSSKYEKSWDFEEYVRLAEPAYYALLALMNEDDLPCVLFSHEFMGMPAALQAILDGQHTFRTVFHAHECAPARRIVEDHPGHDTMFYNVLDKAMARGHFIEDIFGKLDHFLRHALVSRAHLCDGVIAVGDRTRDELLFLNRPFSEHPVELVYNGLPVFHVTPKTKEECRAALAGYAAALLGQTPDLLMTHVTRPVISKGMWRDMKVCHQLDKHLEKQGKTGVLFILTTAGGVRRPQDVAMMEKTYGWPRHHRHNYPDLVGPEVDLHAMIEPFNKEHRNVQVVLVNQFGWSRARVGARLPREMDMADLRIATDVEFGMATYEPFGISPLEPLAAGAICVISNVCGCQGFVNHVTKGKGTPNVVVADFTQIGNHRSVEQIKHLGQDERNAIEEREAARVADEIMANVGATPAKRAALLKSGQALVARMGWDQVLGETLVPMLQRICQPTIANGAIPVPIAHKSAQATAKQSGQADKKMPAKKKPKKTKK